MTDFIKSHFREQRFKKANCMSGRFICLMLILTTVGQLEAVSVREFGAAGDGKTNDSAAFRDAIEAGAEKGEAIDIPPGIYLIQEDIVVDHPVSFTGHGHKVSVITSGGEEARIYVRQSGTTFRNIGFEKMIEPIALESRSDYVLKNLLFERCRFENIEVRDSNRGAIGLSSGNSSQREHRIENLVIRECLFRAIDAHAVNIRANIGQAQVVQNVFLEIVNNPASQSPPGGYAIRLGNSLEEGEGNGSITTQGWHCIEGNVIRKLRKTTIEGNCMAILLYGDHNIVSKNFIEDIDATAKGLDTNAMYIRGSYNRIVSNTVRNVRGADDDGAVSLKGGMEAGNQKNIIAYNVIEGITGMSAVEVSTSDLLFFENEIRDASTRGFYHRLGRNLSVTDNLFSGADAVFRTDEGKVVLSGNNFVESGIALEQRRGHPSRRDSVHIQRNQFQRTNAQNPVIRLGNRVEDQFVSIRENTFRNRVTDGNDGEGGVLIDLTSSGSVRNTEIVNNLVDQAGQESLLFRIGDAAGGGRFAGNMIVIRDLRGPVMESAFRTIENNTVRIVPGAGKEVALEAMFVVAGLDREATVTFHENRFLNHANHLLVDELIRVRGSPGEIRFSDNVVEGNVSSLGDFRGNRFTSVGNTLSSGLE